jgi:hypothetical protein
MAKKKRQTPRIPNYLRKLRYLQRLGVLPSAVGVHQVDVAHDGWYAHFQGYSNPRKETRFSGPDGITEEHTP